MINTSSEIKQVKVNSMTEIANNKTKIETKIVYYRLQLGLQLFIARCT